MNTLLINEIQNLREIQSAIFQKMASEHKGVFNCSNQLWTELMMEINFLNQVRKQELREI